MVLSIDLCLFPILANCTFDRSYCAWRNAYNSWVDDIDWHARKSGTPSIGTGPSEDHTGNLNNLPKIRSPDSNLSAGRLMIQITLKWTLNDVCANCFCARYSCRNVTPRHASSPRVQETFLQSIGRLAISLSLRSLNSHRCLVTPFFLCLYLFPWFSGRFQKIWPWEVIYFFSFSTQKGASLCLSLLGMTSNFFLQNVIFNKWNDTNYK